MYTRKCVNSIFTDECITNAKNRGVNLTDLAKSVEIVPVTVTIELPVFVIDAIKSGVKLEDFLEELVLDRVLQNESLMKKVLDLWDGKKEV